MRIFGQVDGFDWDDANYRKNLIKHDVSAPEAEQVFFNAPFVVHEDLKHSASEPRFHALGRTDEDRRLLVVFTLRGSSIRVISARPQDRYERKLYEKICEKETNLLR